MVEFSEKRKSNLEQAFHEIEWKMDDAQLLNEGVFGDKPQYGISGIYKNIKVFYTTRSAGGCNSIMNIFKDGKLLLTISPANYKNSFNIMKVIRMFNEE